MRLVHGDQAQLARARQARQPVHRRVGQLRGHVDERVATRPGALGHARVLLGRPQEAGDLAPDPRVQGGHLVGHQRDEGADDDGDLAGPRGRDEGGHLVADRLARARRHDDQAVPAGQHGRDDLLLAGPEGGEAPVLSQDGERGGGRGRGRGGGGGGGRLLRFARQSCLERDGRVGRRRRWRRTGRRATADAGHGSFLEWGRTADLRAGPGAGTGGVGGGDEGRERGACGRNAHTITRLLRM